MCCMVRGGVEEGWGGAGLGGDRMGAVLLWFTCSSMYLHGIVCKLQM